MAEAQKILRGGVVVGLEEGVEAGVEDTLGILNTIMNKYLMEELVMVHQELSKEVEKKVDLPGKCTEVAEEADEAIRGEEVDIIISTTHIEEVEGAVAEVHLGTKLKARLQVDEGVLQGE